MLRIYGCIVDQHDLRLVALAAVICVFASGTAIDLLARAQQGRRLAWSVVAAIIFGSGVWATHFVAELAYEPGLPLGYDIGLTALSFAIAMAMTWLGFGVALRYDAPLLGGSIVGAGVGAMHYVGMAALRLPAIIHWDPAYVASSLVIGMLLSAAAVRVSRAGDGVRQRVMATGLIVAAICGLHFTAMAAAVIVPDPLVLVPDEIVKPKLLAIVIAAVMGLIILLGISGLVAGLARNLAREAERLRRSEAQLRRSERHLARAQELAEIGSFERHSGAEAMWSDNLYRIFGVDRQSFVINRQSVLALIHPDDRARYESAYDSWFASGQPEPLSFRVVRRDGACRHLVLEADLRREDGGAVTGLFGSVRDVTSAVRADEQRRELQAQLHHSQRLEALGTLAGGIAHDLNNTLVPIVALGKMAMKRLPDGSREQANMVTIQRAGERARDLVQQILAFSRKDAPKRQLVDFVALLRDSLRMSRASLPATIRLEEVIDTVPLVYGDPSQLHQVVINLLVNAGQAIGASMGTITVSLAVDAEAAPSHQSADPPRPMLRLAVRDTGCGMDEATMQRVFEPFFTTKPVGEGTGLGLSVVHGIVTQHGGRVTVESSVGQGTCVTAYLPGLGEAEEAERLAAAEVAA
jgi:PAS domain S-box-containing protein